MTSGELPGRVLLAVAWRDHTALIRWSARDSDKAGHRTGNGRLGLDGELLAAPACAGAHRREIADVIWCSRAFAHTRPEPWLGRMLSCHPGCAVAAVQLGVHECAAGTRAGCLLFSLRGHCGLAACGPLLPASFAYAWLAAGWPLSALARTRLEVAGDLPAVACGTAGEELTRLAFSLSYEGSAPGPGAGPDSPSLRRT